MMNSSEMTQAVSILGGTGSLGMGVAARLATAGVPVCIGSRTTDKAEAAVEALRKHVGPDIVATAADNFDAVGNAGRIVILTVPLQSQVRLLKDVKDAWSPGKILVDTTVPLAPAVGGRPTELVHLWSGSAAQQARAHVPAEIGLVSALHTVSAATLWNLVHALDQDTFVCGDKRDEKAVVSDLLGLIPGLRVVDAGGLSASRIAESITAMLVGINVRNKTHSGIRITGLPQGVG
jgi:8-hydroxy-5-deazaflavin:NADPH oxidoreductase